MKDEILLDGKHSHLIQTITELACCNVEIVDNLFAAFNLITCFNLLTRFTIRKISCQIGDNLHNDIYSIHFGCPFEVMIVLCVLYIFYIWCIIFIKQYQKLLISLNKRNLNFFLKSFTNNY